jgi:cytochrome c
MKTPLLVFLTVLVAALGLGVIACNASGGELSGEKVFKKKCKACHSLTKKKVGPPLGDIWDKKAGSQKGYKYSKAMKRSKVIWTDETLDSFLANPKKYIKGTKMKIKGLKPNHWSAVIQYLKPDSEEEEAEC